MHVKKPEVKNLCHSPLNPNTNCRLNGKFFGQFNSRHIHTVTMMAYAIEGLNLPYLKVPKCEIFDLFNFNDFYVMKCL
jgi:hypothetical protein